MNHDRFITGNPEYANTTTVHPLGLTLLLVLGFAMLCVPRRYTMVVLILCASLIASGQRLVIFGIDFSFLRLMVMFTWTRILLRGEYRNFRWNRLDYVVIAWNMAAFSLFIISHGFHTVIFKLGNTFDSMGTYFLVRCLVRDLDDIRAMIPGVAITGAVVMCFFIVESTTKRNMFAVFGGVPEITAIREGKLRCQGAYAHPILAGCFYAVLVQLFVSRALSPGFGRLFALLGIGSSLVIIALCNSSTPIVGVFSGILAFCCFPIRRHMRLVRWGIVLALIALQGVMLKPVYTLIGRITLSDGNTGRHRVAILDAAIEYFSEWALCGTAHIDHWNIYANDITNKYIAEGISGGIVQLTLFITMIVFAFSNVGRLWRKVNNSSADALMAWSIGVALLVHIVNFIGVTYFGQIETLWTYTLAISAVQPAVAGLKKRGVNTGLPHTQQMAAARRSKEMAYM
ncbi:MULTISPECIES: hypothetical protein [unclassified Schlesneria]|uniref:hypothetical protein n=1 Tax=unclassified Schlesneria TaxID=2762017 RepID=UPI002F17188A